MDELMQRRKDKQPLEYPSAGSVFKRPTGYFAGALTNLGIFFTLCVSALFFFGTYGIILLMLRETFVTSTLESCLRLVKKRG